MASSTLLDDPTLDTRLARLLLAQGRLTVDQLQAHLDAARVARPGGASLARRLLSAQALEEAEAEACLAQLAGLQSAATQWRPGAVVDDYVLEEQLGKGGMGVVFAARHTPTGARRALKALPASNDAELVLRFQREGRACARVDASPNIARIYGCGTALGCHYLVMDLVSGPDLGAVLKSGPLEIERAVEILEALARGVAHAHAHGVLHRDLKPSNVLVTEEGVPKLVDFGVAWVQGEAGLTKTGTTLGTPAYMAPEQANSLRSDERTDVYGLGALLYATLTGQPPFHGASVLQTLVSVMKDAPDPPSTINAAVPASLDAICSKALAKNKDDRFTSAEDFADALERFRTGEEEPNHSRLFPWLVVSFCVLVLGAVGAMLLTSDPAPSRPTDPPPQASTVKVPRPAAVRARKHYLRTMAHAIEKTSPAKRTRERLSALHAGLNDDEQAQLALEKQRLFAEQSDAWCKALEAEWAAQKTSGAIRVLERLAATASAPPLTPPPAAVEAVLERLLERMVEAAPRPTPREREKILQFEALRVYELRSGHEPAETFQRWVKSQMNDMDGRTWELTLAGMRCDVVGSLEKSRLLPQEGLETLSELRPDSRAVALCTIYRPVHQQRTPPDIVHVVELAIDPTAVDDLGPRLRRRSMVYFAQFVLLCPDRRDLWERGVDQARRARAEPPALEDSATWGDSHLTESRLLDALGKRDEALRALEGCIDRLSGEFSRDGRSRIRVLNEYVRLLTVMGRAEEAIPHAEKAVSLLRQFSHSDMLVHAARALAELQLDTQEDAAAAEETLRALLPQGSHNVAMTRIAVRVALEQGRLDEARERLKRGRSLKRGPQLSGDARSFRALERLIAQKARATDR